MITALPWNEIPGHPGLFTKYLTDANWRKQWMGADTFSDAAILKRLEYLKKKSFDTKAITEALEKQNAPYHSGAVKASLNKSKQKDCLYIITGQQPATFGGPLYNLYKALSVIQYAKKVEKLSKQPCVPLFWVAGNDHDAEEADAFYILNKSHRLEKISLSLQQGLPLNEVPIFKNHAKAQSIANQKSFHQEHSDLAKNYFKTNDGQSLSEQFSNFIMNMFSEEGLLVIETKNLQSISEKPFQLILEKEDALHKQIIKNSEELNTNGFHTQVSTEANGRFLAYQAKHGRKRVIRKNKEYYLNEQKLSNTNHWLKDKNLSVTPDALGRPLWQDLIFPTVSYIAGPGEISYFHQLKDCYELLNMQMPLILPRLSATLISKRQIRLLNTLNLKTSQFHLLPTQMNTPDYTFQNEQELLDRATSLWATDLQDKQEKVLFEKNMAKLRHIQTKYYQKVASHRQNKLGIGSKQLAEVRDVLLPLNKLQERVFGAYPFLCQHGLSFVNALKKLPYKAGEHLIVELDKINER